MVRTSPWLPLLCAAAFAVTLAAPPDLAFAKTVRIPKKGAKCADDPACHNRWHPDIKPAATAIPATPSCSNARRVRTHSRAARPARHGATSTSCIR